MTRLPEAIYLQCYDEAGELLDLVHDDVTWCVDQINECDAVYKLASKVDYWQRQYEESQPMRIRLMRESRIRKVCLEIAMKALRHYDRLGLAIPKKALAQINERLAQLEPEEEAG